ncbi:unnamed protein product [Lathyrus sativus]|nr:unnamed protein product [Lathyrus sativus]
MDGRGGVEEINGTLEFLQVQKVSAINKRNHCSMDDASLHTGGSIPHRLHWKRIKKEKGADPSLTEFYFSTYQRKGQSWGMFTLNLHM